MFTDLLRKVRPAPLQAAILGLAGLSRRREIPYGEYTFYSDPTSTFGYGLLNGGYEPKMVEVLRRYLHAGSLFLDLGANEGFFSVVASKLVGSRGQVISIEPQTRLISTLQKNLSLNQCYNCRVIQCALTDKNGKATIYLAPTTNTGSTSLYRTKLYPVRKEIVSAWKLEDLLVRCGIETIDLVKVDVEGGEYSIFMSVSERFLASGVLRSVAVEYHSQLLEKQGLSFGEIHQKFLSCGYSLNHSIGPLVYEFRGHTQLP